MVTRTALAVLLLTLGGFAAAPARADEPRGKAEYEMASRFFEAEEYEAALPYFERAYIASGRRPAAILGLAQCLRALKRYGDAIARYEEYLATGPVDAAGVEETLRLLRALDAHAAQQSAERAAERAEHERRAREAEARTAEARAAEARSAEVERERLRHEATQVAEQAARRIAAEEAARHIAAEKLPPPALVAAPVAAPATEDDSVLSHPVFWVVAGVLAAGGGAAAVLFATRSEADPYAGSTGVLLTPQR